MYIFVCKHECHMYTLGPLHEYTCIYIYAYYGGATISRLLKIKGLFCKRVLLKRRYSAKETYNLKEPTNPSHMYE